jgi:molybdenum cofactor cytidylyltransferase
MTTAHKPTRGLNFGVAILAAGRSERMGRPKLLLPWGDTSVLGHLLLSWTGLAAGQVTVVCGATAVEIQTELDRLQFPLESRIQNPSPEAGMFSSIQCAARWPGWSSGLTHFAIALGDQPHLERKTLQQLLDFAATHPEKICQPMRNGRRRHPVILPREVFVKLREYPANDLKQFLNSAPELLAGCEMDDPGLDLDLDWPGDYERAKTLADSR